MVIEILHFYDLLPRLDKALAVLDLGLNRLHLSPSQGGQLIGVLKDFNGLGILRVGHGYTRKGVVDDPFSLDYKFLSLEI